MTKMTLAIATMLMTAAGTASAQAPAPKPAAPPAAAAPAAAPAPAPAPAAKPAAAAPAPAPAAKPAAAAPAPAPATKPASAPIAQAPAPATKPAGAPAPAAAPPAAKPAAPPAAPAAAPGAKPAAPAAAAPAAAPAAGAPAAAAAPPMVQPKPAKELETFMKSFEGTWKCDTKFFANAMGPGSPEMTVKSKVAFKKEMGGMFYRGDYETKKQKGFDMTMKGIFYIGYDPGSQQVIVTGIDSSGGAAFGAGKITGDTVTYVSEGYMMGAKTKMRESMGKKSDKEGFHKFDIDTGKGFIPFGEDTCKK